MARSFLNWTIKDVPIKTRFGTIYATPIGEDRAHFCTRPSSDSGVPETTLTLRAIPYYVSANLQKLDGVWTAPIGQYGRPELPYATRRDHKYDDASISAKETMLHAIASAFAQWAETHASALLEAERVSAHNRLRAAELALEEATKAMMEAQATYDDAKQYQNAVLMRCWKGVC